MLALAIESVENRWFSRGFRPYSSFLVQCYSEAWLPRMGRAIGLTAGLYVVVTIGAIPIRTILFGKGPSGARDGFAAASPFWGVGFSSAVFGGTADPGHEIEKQAAWLVFWIVAYGLVAFGLLLATLKTFNRCLGRFDGPAPRAPLRVAGGRELAGHQGVGPLHGGPEEGRCRESAAGHHGL
jgi:hypothetical protein